MSKNILSANTLISARAYYRHQNVVYWFKSAIQVCTKVWSVGQIHYVVFIEIIESTEKLYAYAVNNQIFLF